MENHFEDKDNQLYLLIDQYWKCRRPENQGSEEHLNLVEQDYLMIGNYYPQWLELNDDYEGFNQALSVFYGKQYDIHLYEQLCQLIANLEQIKNFAIAPKFTQELAVLANQIINEEQNSWQTLWAVFQKLNENTTLSQSLKDAQIDACFGTMQNYLLNHKRTKMLASKQNENKPTR